MCFSVQCVQGLIANLGIIVKISVCCVEAPLGVTLSPAGKEGHWEPYIKYMDQNCFCQFIGIHCTNKVHLAVVA